MSPTVTLTLLVATTELFVTFGDDAGLRNRNVGDGQGTVKRVGQQRVEGVVIARVGVGDRVDDGVANLGRSWG